MLAKLFFYFSIVIMVFGNSCSRSDQKSTPIHITATTFPMFQLVNSLIDSVPNVVLHLLIPGNLGCPHDYVLTPSNVSDLYNSNFVIMNGLGLEPFSAEQVQTINPLIVIVNAAATISDSLFRRGGEAVSDVHEHIHSHSDDVKVELNPHYFISPIIRIDVLRALVKVLNKNESLHAEIIKSNFIKIEKKLNAEVSELNLLKSQIKNKSVVVQEGVFDYLLGDLGLEPSATINAHADRRPTSSELIAVIQKIRTLAPFALIVEDDFPEEVISMILQEVDVKVVRWSLGSRGKMTEGSSHYFEIMQKNREELKRVMGSRIEGMHE